MAALATAAANVGGGGSGSVEDLLSVRSSTLDGAHAPGLPAVNAPSLWRSPAATCPRSGDSLAAVTDGSGSLMHDLEPTVSVLFVVRHGLLLQPLIVIRVNRDAQPPFIIKPREHGRLGLFRRV